MNTLFPEKISVVKSVMNSDRDVLKAILDLFVKEKSFELDPCYSSGKFYEDLPRPLLKYDKTPQSDDVKQNDLMNGLPIDNNSIRRR